MLLNYYIRRGDPMSLNLIELEILERLYRRDQDRELETDFSNTVFPLEGKAEPPQELGYYLARLKREYYIDYPDSSLRRGGGTDNIYKSNVIIIWWDDIHLTRKGRNTVEENRKTVVDKVKESTKRFAIDVAKETRKKLIGLLAAWIFGALSLYAYLLLTGGLK